MGEETPPFGRSAAVSVPRPAAAHWKKSGALVYSGVLRLILRRSAPQNTATLQKCCHAFYPASPTFNHTLDMLVSGGSGNRLSRLTATPAGQIIAHHVDDNGYEH